MNDAFILLWMIFFHIIADYNLQGWLASAKQKSYWKENASDDLYKHDYKIALIMHGISWTFMIMFPLAYYVGFNIDVVFVILFAWNIIGHVWIDNLKANKKFINLWTDQILHLLQILITLLLFMAW